MLQFKENIINKIHGIVTITTKKVTGDREESRQAGKDWTQRHQ